MYNLQILGFFFTYDAEISYMMSPMAAGSASGFAPDVKAPIIRKEFPETWIYNS